MFSTPQNLSNFFVFFCLLIFLLQNVHGKPIYKYKLSWERHHNLQLILKFARGVPSKNPDPMKLASNLQYATIIVWLRE